MPDILKGILENVIAFYVIKYGIPIMIAGAVAIWMRIKTKWSWPREFIISFIVFLICLAFTIVIIETVVPSFYQKREFTSESPKTELPSNEDIGFTQKPIYLIYPKTDLSNGLQVQINTSKRVQGPAALIITCDGPIGSSSIGFPSGDNLPKLFLPNRFKYFKYEVINATNPNSVIIFWKDDTFTPRDPIFITLYSTTSISVLKVEIAPWNIVNELLY